MIRQRLEAAGLEVHSAAIGTVDVPGIEVAGMRIRRGRIRTSTDRNLWIRAGGDGPARLLMAHYDSVGGSPGAADNAAAVGVLLELARCVARRPPPVPVILAFTGAEEIGLAGARSLLRDRALGDLRLAVSLDLLGHQRPLAINGVSELWDRRRLQWLANRLEASGADAYVALAHRLVSRLAPQLERSDHGPFTGARIPALHVYGRGSERIYLAYHSPLDTLERLDDPALVNAHKLAAELSYSSEPLPERGDDLGLWLELPGGPVVIWATAARLIEAALIAATAALLVLAWVRRRRRQRGGGLALALAAYTIAWALATALVTLTEALRDQPLAPLLDTGRFVAASAAIAIAGYGALLIVASRRWPLVGGARYHAVAAALELAAGAGLLGLGAFDIAWLPLGCAALLALGGIVSHRPVVCVAVTGAGAVAALAPVPPALFAEAAFHGFWPQSLPLPAALAVIALPPWMAMTGALRAALPPLADPRARRALWAALAILFAVAVALLWLPAPPCSPESAAQLGPACGLV